MATNNNYSLSDMGPQNFDAPDSRDVTNDYIKIAQERANNAAMSDLDRMLQKYAPDQNTGGQEAIDQARKQPSVRLPSTTVFGSGSEAAPIVEHDLKWWQEPEFLNVLKRINTSAEKVTWDDAGKAAIAVGGDITETFAESLPSSWAGFDSGFQEFARTANDFMQWTQKTLGIEHLVTPLDPESYEYKLLHGKPFEYDPKSVGGSFIKEAGRIIPWMAGLLSNLKQTAAKGLIQGPIKASAVSGLGAEFLTNPGEMNFANLFHMMPSLRGPVTEFLASDPDDPKVINKLKVALVDGLMLGVTGEGLVKAIRVLAANKKIKDGIVAHREVFGEVPGKTLIGQPEENLVPFKGEQPANPFIIDLTDEKTRLKSEAELRNFTMVDGKVIPSGIPEDAMPVFDDVLSKLTAEGRNETVAKTEATAWAAHYNAMSKAFNKPAVELYKEAGLRVQSLKDGVPAPTSGTVLDQLPKTERPIVADKIGTIEEKQDLLLKLERGATPQEIESHPVVQRAIQIQRTIPRGPNFEEITPEYLAQRRFVFPEGEVVGYSQAKPKLHDIAKAYAGGTVRSERKAVIILGPPAAGKSSIANPIARALGAAIPDPDDVKKVLPEFEGGFGSAAVHEESSFISSELLYELSVRGDNLVIPKVGLNEQSIKDLVNGLKANGYSVDLLHMKVDPSENYRRMVRRFIETSRLIEDSYFKAVGNKPEGLYNALKNSGHIEGYANIDNSDPAPRVLEGNERFRSILEPALSRGTNNGDANRSAQTGGGSPETATGTKLDQEGLPSGGGAIFASPNVLEDLDFAGAARAVNEQRHKTMLDAIKDVDRQLGLDAQEKTVIGAWTDGAENSTATFIKDIDFETLKVAAAMKGWLGRQKSVLVFKEDASQTDKILASFRATGSLEDIHKKLLADGVEFHTLEPTKDGAIVHVYMDSEDVIPKVEKAAQGYGSIAEFRRGQGDFVGTQKSGDEARTDARRVYEEIIAGRDSSTLDRQDGSRRISEIWSGLRDRWGKTLDEIDQPKSFDQSTSLKNTKVVDKNGKPMVVYHGTDTLFDQFDSSFSGSVSDTSDARAGFWFTSSKNRAQKAAQDAMNVSGTNVPYIKSVYLNLENPKTIKSIRGLDPEEVADIAEKARKDGHDGIIFKQGEGDGSDYLVFENNKVIDASKTFDQSGARSSIFKDRGDVALRPYARVTGTPPKPEPNYVYQTVTRAQADQAAQVGYAVPQRPMVLAGMRAWADGQTNPRVIFSRTINSQGDANIVLRLKRSDQKLAAGRDGSIFSDKPVPANKIEYLSTDGTWKPLTDGPPKKSFNQEDFDQGRVFFSELHRSVNSAPQETARADDWLGKRTERTYTVKDKKTGKETTVTEVKYGGLIGSMKGVKPEEIDWTTGLAEWLQERKGKQVSKQELSDFIRENRVELEEVRSDKSDNTPRDYSELSPSQQTWVDEYIQPIINDAETDWARQRAWEASAKQFSEVEVIQDNQLDLFGRRQPGWRYQYKYTPDPDAPENVEVITSRVYTNLDDARSSGQRQRESLISDLSDNRFDEFYGDLPSVRGLGIDIDELRNQAIDELGLTTKVDTKFDSYKLPGGKNYREFRMVMPERVRRESDNAFTESHWSETPDVIAHFRIVERMIDGKRTLFIEEIQSDWHQKGRKHGYRTPEVIEAEKKTNSLKSEIKELQNKAASLLVKRNNLETSVNARLLFDYMEDPSFVEKHYLEKYERLADMARKDEDVLRLREEWKQKIKEKEDLQRIVDTNLLPDAPFKKTWHELAMKRILMLAVEEGFDHIAWTSGRQQSLRYQDQLRTQISQVAFSSFLPETGTKRVVATPKNSSEQITFYVNRDGKIVDTTLGYRARERAIGSNVEDIFGKQLAERILEDKVDTIDTKDLVLNAKGMEGFYDKMLPMAAEKLGKPFGARVDRVSMEGSYNEAYNAMVERLAMHTSMSREEAINNLQERIDRYESGKFDHKGRDYLPPALAEQFYNLMDMKAGHLNVHHLEITPQLKARIEDEGFPLFQRGENAEPRGRVTLDDHGALVQLFKSNDQSTFMHESSHIWLEELIHYGTLDNAPKQIRQDLATVMRWFGLEDVSEIGRVHHEQWAKGFEQMLASGIAPSPALQGAFERFKNWLLDIYRSIRNLGEPIPDDVRAVMERMLATDTERALAGRTSLIGPEGLSPELQAALAPRLAEAGYDGLLIRGGSGKAVTTFDPSTAAARAKIGQSFAATETGVPAQVTAAGVSGHARVVDLERTPGSGPEVHLNFNRINTPDDIKQTIADLVDAFPDDINETRRGVQTHLQTRKLADELGITPQDILSRQKGETWNAEKMLAARRLLNTSAQKILELADVVSSQNATLADQYNFRRMLAIHHAIQKEIIAARTEAARALNAWAIPAEAGNVEVARAITNLLEDSGGAHVTLDIAQKIRRLKDTGVSTGAINAAAKKSALAITMDMAREMFVLGLLWSPKTHIANMVSNTAVAALQVAERQTGKYTGDLLGSAIDARVVNGESLVMMYGAITGIWDALRLSVRAGISGKSTVAAGSKFDTHRQAISSSAVAEARGMTPAQAQAFTESPLGMFVDFVGTMNRIPGHALAAEDEFFKSIAYRMEVHAQALRQATNEGHYGLDLFQRMRELVNEPPEHIRLAASDAATYMTFQDRMGNIGTGLSIMRNGGSLYNATYLLLPFIKTPINILRYTFERTPLALVSHRWRQDIEAGGVRRDLAIARMATGTMILAAMMDAAAVGLITGNGPDNIAEREALERQGWQKVAVKIGDKYVSINRFDPIGMMASFAGTLTDVLRQKDLAPEDYDELMEVMGAAIGVVSTSVTNKTYFFSVGSFADALKSAEKGTQGFANWATRQFGAFMPFSSLSNTIRQFDDPVQRDVNSVWDALHSRIIKMAERLPADLDNWGREKKPHEAWGPWYDRLSPATVTQFNPEPIDAELQRLRSGLEEIDKKTHVSVELPSGDRISVDVNFYKYPKVYERYKRLAGNELKSDEHHGMGQLEYLNALVSGTLPESQEYERDLTDGKEGTKIVMIKNVQARFRQLAIQQILEQESEQFPEFMEYVQTRAQQLLEAKTPAYAR